jgi:hypothetical protein
MRREAVGANLLQAVAALGISARACLSKGDDAGTA